jgi:2-octaprenyl-6-methoxyphenol hydroxylase
MTDLTADVAIVGGGLVGLSLAIACGACGLTTVVVDRENPADAADDAYDGRGSAIAWGSAQVLRGLGLWEALEPHAGPILDIRVSDGDSLLFLHYDHRAVGAHPLGYIIENRFIRRALYARLAALPQVRLLAPESARLAGADASSDASSDGGTARLALAGGGTIAARLAVACDGRRSALRSQARIGITRWDYAQTAIVASIAHERPHRGIAHERFLPAGPFAVLPLPDAPDGRHQSSIVWTERPDLVPALLALPAAEFADEIMARFGGGLGRITAEGRRWSYPLGVVMADRYVARRVALAGEAAHAIHPIAGQGLNMGLRDVAALAECLADTARLGLDIGAPPALARYERWRRFDNLSLLAVTDVLNRLFSNDIAPVRLARDLGLGLVEQVAPLKRLFMRHAMGVVGDLPRLVKGEPL